MIQNNIKGIPYTLIRSRRRTIALIIDKDANLIVRAPLRARISDIEKFIDSKREWIESKQKGISELAKRPPAIDVRDGGQVMYLGKTYSVIKGENGYVGRDNLTLSSIALEDLSTGIYISGDNIFIPEDYDKEKMIMWLKARAWEIIPKRAYYYAGEMGVEPSRVRISNAKTRWGSCSASDSINFSWHLIMCPMEVIDYVAVHELCHIIHKDHSRAFWNEVGKTIPDYKIRRRWLRDNQYVLM